MFNTLDRIFKTDVRYVLNGGFWLLLGQGIAFIASFGLLWAFTNLLPKEVYGQYRFITTAAVLLSIATLPGLNTALLQSVANGHTNLLGPLLKRKILWGLVGSVGALIGASYYWWQADSTMALLFLAIALFVPFYESFNIYQSYLMGQKQFRSNALLTAALRISIVVGVVSAIALSSNIIVIVVAFLLSSTVAHVLALYVARILYPPVHSQDTTELHTAARYGYHLSAMSMFRWGAQQLDKIVLWYFAGPVQVATYAIAVALPNELTSASGQVSNLALPKMSTRRIDELRSNLLRKVGIFFIALLPLAGLYALIAPYLFTWFFPQYIDTIWYTQIAALTILVAPIGLFSQYFYATKHTKVLYITNFVEPAILVALFAALIPTFGVIGAITAFLIKHLLTFLLYLYFFTFDTRQWEDHHSLEASV